MGFTSSRHDDDVWIKPREDSHDCIVTHAGDFIVVTKDSASCIKKIRKYSILDPKERWIIFLVMALEEKEWCVGCTSQH